MARRRDERIDHAVLAAVRELVREIGYPALTMEAIAQRADTTKPAIRRRWKSQKHLVVEAMARDRAGVVEMDTGCTHCDIVGHLEALRVAMDDPVLGHVLPALVADLADDPELRETFLTAVWAPRREACEASLRKGVARGDLRAGLDVGLVLDLFAAPVVFRALFGHSGLGPDFPADVAHAVLSGVGTGGEHRCPGNG
ncbi:TetR family transcriptional regulator [Streptomyces sp. SID8382]|uniref:TetR/AcrR family transcriptional regulator n=1 Tax=Streptomyces malaysiensis TaxID=92644 RepID=UPI000C2C957B|nr:MULTISPECIES: TetR/AcrR family transcriptional regulator [unclassified Streptomyces]AUA09847.1 Bacterial regulatory protein, tetR family [Streptomyces sp. M56]MYX55384.1 TetR family transcriptional regulator [Streptomyces sp. SID8382]